MLPPEQQCQFLEKFLEKIFDKIAFSSWCNHGVECEEKHVWYLDGEESSLPAVNLLQRDRASRYSGRE
jgi:hypothetical protein